MRDNSLPKCATCGQYTTFQMIRTGSFSFGDYAEDDHWYCKKHAAEEARP